MENTNLKVLVIARKYNDVFYALCTEEVLNTSALDILIISHKETWKYFPKIKKFDNIRYIETYASDNNTKSLLVNVLNTLKTDIDKYDIVIMSNPFLTINQYVVKRTGAKRIVWVEDGLMNYYQFTPSDSKYKRILQRLLGINQGNMLNMIKKTYLLNPDLAKTFVGAKYKINISSFAYSCIDCNIPMLQGKKIFVGQNLYNPAYNVIGLNDYCNLINQIVKVYKIDYYLPHPFASTNETIDCEILNLNEFGVTLEACASRYDFEIFALNSTVLFSTKLINNRIICNSIIPVKIKDKIKIPEILRNNCDRIIEFK